MKRIKRVIKSNPILYSVATKVYAVFSPVIKKVDSAVYWEKRYQSGDTSGAGSYGKFAEYKANFINKFLIDQKIDSAIEFGMGDGSQLQYINYHRYIGLDVSATAIKICCEKFATDKNKSFFLYNHAAFQDNLGIMKCDMALSLDVLFHIIEDDVFECYLNQLFSSATRFVVIYSSNKPDVVSIGKHVKHRCFTDYVHAHLNEWVLEYHEPNIYPYNGNDEETSFSDFYVFKKI